jgi:hypothetical protein
VPTVPVKNEMPDVLSAEAKPEWFDAEYDDYSGEEDDDSLTITERETLEIWAGDH